jgi:hypothetical protein
LIGKEKTLEMMKEKKELFFRERKKKGWEKLESKVIFEKSLRISIYRRIPNGRVYASQSDTIII